MHNYEAYMKRILDVLFAVILLILLSPLLILLALLIRIKLGGPVIFKQQRVGKNEGIFTLYKFRTMTNDTDAFGRLLPVSKRLTSFGNLLRSTSLDELPELLNIVKGDMSFIGPRPLVVEYLPYYTPEERLRHTVRPGLTGLAQINGRNTASWLQRFHYDITYVKHLSFVGDLKIIGKTFVVVLKRSDIGEVGVDAPMDFDEFRQQQQIKST